MKNTNIPSTNRPTGTMPANAWRAALGPGFANGLTQNMMNHLAKSSSINARRY